MKKTLLRSFTMILTLIMLFTMMVPLYADGQKSNNDLLKTLESLETKELKSINDNLKIFKAINKETKEEKYIILQKVHNDDAPKDLPKVEDTDKITFIDDEMANAEEVFWVDRVYFKQVNTLKEAEEVVDLIVNNDSNSLVAQASYNIGDGSYIERIYSSLWGYGYHVHLSPDDAAFLKESLSHWLYFDGAIMTAIGTYLGTPATPTIVVSACVTLITNLAATTYYFDNKNPDGSLDIYMYDNDLAYKSFGVPGVIVYNAYHGKARIKSLTNTLKTFYWLGKTVYIEYNDLHE